MTPTSYPHIVLKESGTPMIEGTRISVARIALDHTLHKIPVEDISAQYGGLTLAEVCAALVYYYDHKEEMDRRMAKDRKELERLRAQHASSHAELLARLEARGARD
jgi:uncharacterized protein (DUF433 family)